MQFITQTIPHVKLGAMDQDILTANSNFNQLSTVQSQPWSILFARHVHNLPQYKWSVLADVNVEQAGQRGTSPIK